MLPGMYIPLVNIADPIVDWYIPTVVGTPVTVDMLNRNGYSVARVTCIGRGGYQVNGGCSDTGGGAILCRSNGGGGGNCSTSIVQIKTGDLLQATFQGTSIFKVNSVNVVVANIAAATGNVGDSVYLGGPSDQRGDYSGNASGSFGTNAGGGAGGTHGDANLTVAGRCVVWTRTSDGAKATAGSVTQDFGGGQPYSSGADPGRGLVVIEWGVDKLFTPADLLKMT